MENKIILYLMKFLLIMGLTLIMPVMVIAQGITLPAVSASIQFTNPIVSNNMFLVVDNNPADEAYTEVATIGGVQCQRIPSGKFMYVGCNRAAVPTSQNNLLIAVTYYANSNNSMWFNYNGISNDYQGADFQKTKTNQWVTVIITITDGALKGNMNGGADFRMGYNGEDNYIKEIKVYQGALDPLSQAVPAQVNSPIAGFHNKSFAGYQIWHQAGPTAADWVHWSYGVVPAAGFLTNENIASFPDLSSYADSVTYSTNLANLGNGNPTRLYNDADSTVINRQMNWIQTAGMDGVAIQRFVGPIGRNITITPESHLTNVKNACEATGRLFYICYDLNGTDATILQRMQMDWVYEIEQMRALTSSPNYATVNGKPVVEMWGVGYNMATAAQCASLISFLQSRGCYVIGGTPSDWRTNPAAGFASVFNSLNAISPWTVGVYNDINGANNYLSNYMVGDKTYCDANSIDYLPVAFAGSANWLSANGSFAQTDRGGGKLLWQQILNAKSIGLTSVYFAMLDEFEESTNLINGAVDYFDIPTDQYFETFAKDGVWTSPDYYLRLAAKAAQTLRGDIPLSTTIQIPYSNGPLYFRNSFESRTTVYNMNGATATETLKIDPCFYNDSVVSLSNVNGQSVAIMNNPSFTKSGLYSVMATGTPTSGASANYYYQMSETKITVKANMQLSFWKYSVNSLGQYTSVDLLFQSGKRLSNLPTYVDSVGYAMTPAVARGTVGTWQKFTCQIGVGQLIGDVITGILIGYDNPSTSGSYTAYFDDIIIEDAMALTRVEMPYGGTAWPIPGKIEAENYDYGGEGIAYNDSEEENKFNQFRTTEAVDVEPTGDVGGGYDVGWIETGEWLNYMVNVQTAGTYVLQARVASGNAGTYTMHVEMDGVNISGPISFNGTGGWQTYQTISVMTPVLNLGGKIMRIVMDAGGFNLNYVNFNLSIPLSLNTGIEHSADVAAKGNPDITVYPNPVKAGGSATLQFINQEKGKYQVRLYNYLGQSVFYASVNVTGNIFLYSLDLPHPLSSGYYQLEIISESDRTMQKIMIE
jgi:hypothetical protein